MLSRLVIAFLPRSKHLLISWLQSPSAVILESSKIKSVIVSSFPHLFAMKWWDQMPKYFFSNVEFWASFFTLLFYIHQEALSPSSLSAIRVVSSGYLRLSIFLPEILIPACASVSLALSMTYCAYKLNKQGHNWQPLHTPVLIWNSPLFHVRFSLLLLDLHTGFLGGK